MQAMVIVTLCDEYGGLLVVVSIVWQVKVRPMLTLNETLQHLYMLYSTKLAVNFVFVGVLWFLYRTTVAGRGSPKGKKGARCPHWIYR